MEREIEPIINTFEGYFKGITKQIEYRRLVKICEHFDIKLTKENYAYCFSIKVVYDGFLMELYKIDDYEKSIKDPEGLAYELTASALGLFKNNKLPVYRKALGDLR